MAIGAAAAKVGFRDIGAKCSEGRQSTQIDRCCTAYELERCADTHRGHAATGTGDRKFHNIHLAKFGSEVVAAFGVAIRIEALEIVGIFAVSMAMTVYRPKFWRRIFSRIDASMFFGGGVPIYIGLLLFIILAVIGPEIGRVFSDDPAVASFVGLFFKVVAISYGFVGIMNVASAIFNGLQMQVRRCGTCW